MPSSSATFVMLSWFLANAVSTSFLSIASRASFNPGPCFGPLSSISRSTGFTLLPSAMTTARLILFSSFTDVTGPVVGLQGVDGFRSESRELLIGLHGVPVQEGLAKERDITVTISSAAAARSL